MTHLWRGIESSAEHPESEEVAVPESTNQRENVWQKDADLLAKLKQQEEKRSSWYNTFFLAYGSLGVIYGDIGTSIIYVFSQIFVTVGDMHLDNPAHMRDDVLGAISLIFWTITLIALFKYVGVVLRANDTGEGGTVALYAQLCRTMGISPYGTMRRQDHRQVLAMRSAASFRSAPNIGEHRHRTEPKPGAADSSCVKELPLIRRRNGTFGIMVLESKYMIRWFRKRPFAQRCLLFLTMVATGLVIGDGILMPAFSVNSAISGIEQHTQDGFRSSATVGLSIAIIVMLFVSQHIGTQKIAFLFSPIIMLWLLSNLAIAIHNLRQNGCEVFQGLNPWWIFNFFNKYGRLGWEMLGGVMLCVSGTETMFAAMGHFSQPAVAVAFGCFAYPCLILTYLGQGAYLLKHPEDSRVAFWASIPNPVFWPMLVLATLAAIVASQAAITGTFSIIRQATALGVFPKLRVVHTDSLVEGQIFIPAVNYSLMLLSIAVIAGFGGDNNKLGDAYGVAVMAVMLITTAMVTIVMMVKWNLSLLMVIPFCLLFTLIEGVFLSANLFKVPSGGWFPLAVAIAVCIIMSVWWSGTFMRRRVLLGSCKEQDVSAFFVIYSQESPDIAQTHHSDLSCESRPVSELGSPFALLSSATGHLTTNPLMSPRLTPELSTPLLPLGRTSVTPMRSNTAENEADAAAPMRLSDVHVSSRSVRFDETTVVRSMSQGFIPRKQTSFSSKGSVAAEPAKPALTRPVLALVSHPDQPLSKLSGLGLYYSDSPIGMPLVMRHFLKNADAMHEAGIFITVRFLPMPSIKNSERFLVRAIQGLSNYYQVVCRYGYQDIVDHSQVFVQQVLTTIMHKLELKAGLRYQGLENDFIHELEGEFVEEEPVVPEGSERVFGLEIVHESFLGEEEEAAEEEEEVASGSVREREMVDSPFISRFAMEAMARICIVAGAPDAAEAAKEAADAARMLVETAQQRVVYYLGRGFTRSSPSHSLVHNITIGGIFKTMEMLSYTDSEAWNIPLEHMVELGIALEV